MRSNKQHTRLVSRNCVVESFVSLCRTERFHATKCANPGFSCSAQQQSGFFLSCTRPRSHPSLTASFTDTTSLHGNRVSPFLWNQHILGSKHWSKKNSVGHFPSVGGVQLDWIFFIRETARRSFRVRKVVRSKHAKRAISGVAWREIIATFFWKQLMKEIYFFFFFFFCWK